jgi:hypothetical protein
MIRGGLSDGWLGGCLITTHSIKLECYAMLQGRGIFGTRLDTTLELGIPRGLQVRFTGNRKKQFSSI